MVQPQAEFLATFETEFTRQFGTGIVWRRGQSTDNKAVLRNQYSEYRRDGVIRPNEGFELGDLRGDYRERTVVIEYDSAGLDTHNLLKYRPFLLGALSQCPALPLIVCHFSSWHTYGSRRDEWPWLYDQMCSTLDLQNGPKIVAEQFDNGL